MVLGGHRRDATSDEGGGLLLRPAGAAAGWETIQPTLAIHEIQGNADPYHYAPFFDPATTIVQTPGGLTPSGSCGSVSGDAQGNDLRTDV